MTVEEQTEAEPEAGEQPSRIAGGCVAVVLTGAAGAVAYAVPETAYFVAGLLAAATVRKARGWATARRDRDQPEAARVDIAEQLRALSDGGNHVLLTQLQTAADQPDTKAVRALLDEAGIRVRAGVRTPAGNGPGVHQDDIPAPLPRDGETPSGRCLCSSDANANTNNRPQVEHNEWGVTITDPTEQHRRQHVPRAN